MKAKILRGNELDKVLKDVLNQMIKDGYQLSPITRTNVQKKIGLKSRSTFITKDRSDLIDNARKIQLKNAGLDADARKKRNGLNEQLRLYKEKLTQLQNENTLLIEKIAVIITGLHSRGLDVEELMKPLRAL